MGTRGNTTRHCDMTPSLRSGSQTLQDGTQNKPRDQEGGNTVEDPGEGRGTRSMQGNKHGGTRIRQGPGKHGQ